MTDPDFRWQMKYCRTCACEMITGVHIFKEEGKRLGLADKLRKTLSVLVLEEDLLPKRICTDCCISLEEYSHYKGSVLDAQEKLKGIAKSMGTGGKREEIILPVPSASATSESVTVNCGKKLVGSTSLESHQKDHIDSEPDDNDAVEGEPIATPAEDDPVPPSTNEEASIVEDSNSSVPSSFPCEFCNEIFDDPTAYYSHTATSHKGKRHQCPSCALSYAQKASLTIHIRNHHSTKDSLPKKNQACQLCPATFFDKKELTRHSKTHLAERSYPCYICNKFYKTSKCLSKHITTHLSVNKFQCNVCQKGFNRKNHLEEHENTHGQSSLGCQFCPKTFNNYPNYSKHVRRIHENKVGEKIPPPIKNIRAEPPPPTVTPAALTTTLAPSATTPTSTVTNVWVEAVSPLPRATFHNLNAVDGIVVQSDTGNAVPLPSMSTASGTMVETSSVRELTPIHDPNQPMELCYKITSTGFQDMPMELTKVFQESGPLELCVRTETELSHFMETSSASKEQHNFNAKLDLIDLSNVAPFQQQPMDLINRDSYCCNLTSVNNSMNLSLRSSFPDQSDTSFIRELLDLSSRSDHDPNTSHGHHHHQHNQMELNLSCPKHPQVYRAAPPPHPGATFLNAYSDNLF